MCAAFRPLYVTKEQANKCEYPVSGSVWFRPEQISITDSVSEQWQPDHTIIRCDTAYCEHRITTASDLEQR